MSQLSTVAVNGEVRRWEDLRLHDFAQGFFTTFRIDSGAPLFLARHLARLRASLAAFPGAVRAPPPEQLTEATVRDTLRRCLDTAAALGPGFTGVVGKLSELPTANLFFHLDGALVTPPLDAPCLPGIAREVPLEAVHVGALPVVERPVPLARLADTSAYLFTNSAVLAIGVPRLLGREMPGRLALAEWARVLIADVARREG